VRLGSVVLAALVSAACSDALEQDTTAGQVIVVADSSTNGLSIISASRFTATGVSGGGEPFAGPLRMTARDSFVFLTVGTGDSLVMLHLVAGGGTAPSHFYGLGAGSRGVGSIAVQSVGLTWQMWVPLSGTNRVMRATWPVIDTASFATGPHPMAAAIVGGTLFVVNANAVNDSPAGPSSLTWLSIASPTTGGTIPLTGTNGQFITPGADGLLYVVMRGAAGGADGRLSVVEPVAKVELAVINGLGELPGAAVYHASGRLLIASAGAGILELNTLTRTLDRGPGQGIRPGTDGVAALALDQRGRVYAVSASCGPGTVRVLTAPPTYATLRTVTVGSCVRAAAAAYQAGVP